MTVDWYTLHADGSYSPQVGPFSGKTDPGVDFKVAGEPATDPDGAEFFVSTVFLGLDHQYGNGPPLVFETMVFPGEDGDIAEWGEKFCDRYTTIEQAREGHAAAVQMVRDGRLGEDE